MSNTSGETWYSLFFIQSDSVKDIFDLIDKHDGEGAIAVLAEDYDTHGQRKPIEEATPPYYHDEVVFTDQENMYELHVHYKLGYVTMYRKIVD